MIEFSVKRPIATSMFLMIFVFLGMLAFFQLPVDTLPKIEYPILTVSTSYRGAGPEQVETGVTKILENAFTLLHNVDEIVSYSQEGSSSIRIQYEWGVNLDDAIFDVREKIDLVRGHLPDDVDTIRILKYSNDDDPILGFMIVGIDDQATAFEFANEYIKKNLEGISGVGEVVISGGIDKEIHIELNQNRLLAHKLNINDIANAINHNNIQTSGGHLIQGKYKFGVRANGKLKSLEDIRNIIVDYRYNFPIFLKDIALIYYGNSDNNGITYASSPDIKDESISNVGRTAVLLEIVKTSEANTVEVIDRVKRFIDKLSTQLPSNVHILEMYNNATSIKNAIQGLVNSGIQGLVIALLMLFFYLWHGRSLIIIGLSIPVSIIVSFISMYIFNVSFNTVSLAGLTLAIGMVVDSSIVVLENIFHYKKNNGRYRASILGAKEVALAIIASTFTTIAVFFPILFLKGNLAQTFRDLVITVVSGLLASLMIALTLVPMLTSLLIPEPIVEQRHTWHENFLKKLDYIYLKALKKGLKYKKKIILMSLVFVTLGSFLLYKFINKENQPASDEGHITITLNYPMGTRYEENHKFSREIMKDIKEYLGHYLESMNLRVRLNWRAAVYDHRSRLRIKLIPSTERKESIVEIAEGIRKIIANYPVKYWLNMGGRGRAKGESIQIELHGNNLKDSHFVADKIIELLKKMPDIRNPRNTSDSEITEIALIPNRVALVQEGISPIELFRIINTSFGGRKVTSIIDMSGNDVELRVQIQEEDRLSLEDLNTFQIVYKQKKIPLRSLVDIKQQIAPRGIERSEFTRLVDLRASLVGEYEKNIIQAVDDIISNINQHIFLPPGVRLSFKGDYEDAQKNLFSLAIAILLSVFIVYSLMAALFESYIAPFVIMFSVPFGIFGALLTLYITGNTLNIFSTVGIVVLVGVVINNGIVLVDYTNKLFEEGIPLEEAIQKAGFRRLRPVCMTTFTTILGTLPVALGLGEGSERYAPFAVSIIGGLFVSTFFTLFIIPLLYCAIRKRYPYRLSKKDNI